MKNNLKLIAVLGLFSVMAGFVNAEDVKNSKTLLNKMEDGYLVIGDQQHHKVINDLEITGGKAIEVAVTGQGGPWQAGALALIVGDINAGDKITVNAYLRSTTESKNPGKVIVRVEQAGEPWTTIYEESVLVGDLWNIHKIDFVADKRIPAGSTQVTLHLNSEAQVVFLGPLSVINEGKQSKK